MQVESPGPEISAEEARRTADAVLSGRGYLNASRPPSLRERIFDWIAEVIGDLFNALSTSGGRGPIAWVIIALFGGLVAFLVWKLVRTYEPLPTKAKAPKPTIDIIGDLTADEWLAKAETAEAEGDWRASIRCRHRVLVATLLDRGLITPRPGLTAGEIAAMVAERAPASADSLWGATNVFKDTWYGGIEADRATRDRFVGLSDQTLAALPTSEQPVLVGADA